MKKLIVVFFILALTLSLCLVFGGMAYAEEEEVVYPCNVISDIKGYGDVICDIEGGEIGDIVTLTLKPYVLCKLDFIKVNDVDLVPLEDGTYQFALAEGDNVITAKFILDPDQMGSLGTYVQQIEEEGLSSVFTIKNLISLLAFLFSTVAGCGFLWQAIRTAKQEKAFKVLNSDVLNAIEKNFGTYAANCLAPIINNMNLKLENVISITSCLGRCMIIAQEDTPQARMAIIEELSKIQTLSTELGEQIKILIQAEVDKNAEELAKQKETIAELEKSNEAIVVEEPKVEAATETTQQDEYGQF